MKTLKGRRYEIAQGQHLDGHQVLQYRQRWSEQGYELPELIVDEPREPRSKSPGVGDIFAGKIGKWAPLLTSAGKGCKACADLRRKMNRAGWAAANQDHIVSELLSRRGRLAALVPEGLAEAGIRKWLTESIAEYAATVKARPKRQQRRRQPAARVTNTPTPGPLPEFTDEPRLTLMFHVWPHGDGWRRHLPKLEVIKGRFDRLLLGVATDSTTATVEEVVEAFGDRWEVTAVKNNASKKTGLREVATYQEMITQIDYGVNDVTFCGHSKGTQAHTGTDVVTWWTDAMYETVLHNIDGVIAEMRNGAAIVGSFRRHGPFLRTAHKWHYSGTFYAFRNIACNNGPPSYQRKWWGTESWPGDHFPLSASACIFADHVGHLYKPHEQPREELEQWRQSMNSND